MDGITVVDEEPGIGIFKPSEAHVSRVSAWFLADYEVLLRFAYFVAGDRSEAEDLVQEAFARVSEASERLQADGFRAYARKTIVNLSRSAFRRKRIEQRVLGLMRSSEVYEMPDRTSTMDMRRALLRLAPRQRACLALRYYEDMKESDIASAMGMSLAAVKKEIERGKRKLVATLGDREGS